MNGNNGTSWLGLAVWAALLFTLPVRADQANRSGSEREELIRRGNSQMRAASTVMWTGAALLPVSALALVPVLYDGAFGITAADPGFAAFFAVAGAGLIHLGIPIYGTGAGKLEQAAGGAQPGGPGSVASGWSHYRRGWMFMIGGTAVLAAAVPFVAAAGLDWTHENKRLQYTAATLAYSGIGLFAIGALEQHFSLYRFAQSAGHARERLRTGPQVSLQPLLLMDRLGPGAGMRLACSF